MRKRTEQTNLQAPFQKIEPSSYFTGLSQNFLRTGCKNGTVPHIKVGNTYYINIPALLKQFGVPDVDAMFDSQKDGAQN